MSKFKLCAVVALFTLAAMGFSMVPERIQYWNAARTDYAIAAERLAEIEPEGPRSLDLSDLRNLGDLPPEIATKANLTRLDLSNTNVTNLGPLAALRNLEDLSLNNMPIQDLSPLFGIRKLVDLSLSRTWIFDLTPIASLPVLEQLNLSYTAVKSLEPILQLDRIEQLTLYRSYAHDGSQEYYNRLSRRFPRVNNGTAYRQNYKPGWLYRMRIRFHRFRQSWMVDRPKIS